MKTSRMRQGHPRRLCESGVVHTLDRKTHVRMRYSRFTHPYPHPDWHYRPEKPDAIMLMLGSPFRPGCEKSKQQLKCWSNFLLFDQWIINVFNQNGWFRCWLMSYSNTTKPFNSITKLNLIILVESLANRGMINWLHLNWLWTGKLNAIDHAINSCSFVVWRRESMADLATRLLCPWITFLQYRM